MTISHDGKTKVVKTKKPVPKLIVRKGNNVGKEYKITKEEISIGRSPDCEVPVNDNNMSRKHARIVFLGGIFFIYDNESLNGTFVNGKKLVEAQLSSGDIIKIGETEFEFEFTKPKRESFPKFNDHSPQNEQEIDDADLPPLVASKDHNRKKFYTIAMTIIAVLFIGMIALKKYKTAQLSQKKSSAATQSRISHAKPTPKLTPGLISKPIEESTTTTYYSQGLLAMTAGEYREALSLFEKTLKEDPTHQSAPVKIVKCKAIIDSMIRDYFNAGLREFEIRYYERAIIEWNKVATLAKGYDKEMYGKALDRIKEAKIHLRNQKNKSEQ